jgi:hypothetical protein
MPPALPVTAFAVARLVSLLLVDLPEFLIKELGAWRNQVYQVYMDLFLFQKLAVHGTWFDAMHTGQLDAELLPAGPAPPVGFSA